jgi:hypothetical protein
MTYKELLEKLKLLSPEQLNTDVTVYACDENFSGGEDFFPVNELLTMQLLERDPYHPYLIFYK